MAWTNTGFDKDVFKLLMRMKGGTSRLKVLNALSAAPKDRLQLSRDQFGLEDDRPPHSNTPQSWVNRRARDFCKQHQDLCVNR